MKRYLIIIAILVASGLCHGQQITRTEYYIGTDPGFGMATPVPVSSSGDNITLSFTASTQALAEGFHFINIRAKDDLGKWGFPVQRIFYVFKGELNAGKLISGIEYFIDTDPGFGKATSIEVPTPENDLTINFSSSANTLPEGFHYLCIRVKDDLSKWGLPVQRIFYVFKQPSDADIEITGVEYFIDTDPGFGMGTPIAIPSPDKDLTLNFSVDVSALNDGDHVLYVRSKDGLNRWGQMHSQGFSLTVTSLGEIQIEPWFILYPNPSKGGFYLEFTEAQNSQLRIYINDLNGKRVYEKELNNRVNLLNLNLPTGMYLLNVELENKSFSQKIIIH
jgi:hypothetical protein